LIVEFFGVRGDACSPLWRWRHFPDTWSESPPRPQTGLWTAIDFVVWSCSAPQ